MDDSMYINTKYKNMVSTHLEKIFFQYVFKNKDYIGLVKESFFETDAIKESFIIAEEFYNKYGDVPSRDQMVEIIKVKGKEDIITSAKLGIMYDVNLTDYDNVWLEENVEAWIEFKSLDNSVMDLLNYMQTTSVTPENVKEVVQNAKSLILDRNNIDFKFDAGLDFFDPESHIQPTSDTFSTGYDFLDKVTGGGFSIKTLWVFLGQAKVGKCFSHDTIIKIRNKHTGEVQEIQAGDFHEMTKANFKTKKGETSNSGAKPNIAYITK